MKFFSIYSVADDKSLETVLDFLQKIEKDLSTGTTPNDKHNEDALIG